MAESDKKRFKLELNQFEKLGYYIKVKNKNSDKNALIFLQKKNYCYLIWLIYSEF